MKNKTGQDRCARCGVILTYNNLGDCIEAEEIIVCESCAEKHRLFMIKELLKFRKSKDFNNVIKLRKKILWTSEKMGHWFDAGDKSYIENVSDYDYYNKFELQITLLDMLQSLLENYIFPNGLEEDYDEAIKKNPDMEKLRLEVRKQQGKLVSYIDTREFIDK